jgi:hypothetical protein
MELINHQSVICNHQLLCLLAVCCLLPAVLSAQWTAPVEIDPGVQTIGAAALFGPSGDTVWFAQRCVRTSPAPVETVVRCRWTTGDSWHFSADIAAPGPVETRPCVSGGCDPSHRVWVSWYGASGLMVAERENGVWSAPEVAVSGALVTGRQSFAADSQGNWYLAFEAQTPTTLGPDRSSVLFTRHVGNGWTVPDTLGKGTSNPMDLDNLSPVLATCPDSGVWAVYTLSFATGVYAGVKKVFGDRITAIGVLQSDTVAATGDAAGQLWIAYGLLRGVLFFTQNFESDGSIDTLQIPGYVAGQRCMCGDPTGTVWVCWQPAGGTRPEASYCRNDAWSPAETLGASGGVPEGLVSDPAGRIYALYSDGGYHYSTYCLSAPDVQESPAHSLTEPRQAATFVRGELELPLAACRLPLTASLLDISGRKVMTLHSGANDVSHLSPGVYFVSEEPSAVSRRPWAVCKVIVQH